MSRIGKLPITVPNGVNVEINGKTVKIKGPKGELSHTTPKGIEVKIEENTITVSRATEEKKHRALHGLNRTLINNMVIGVTDGFQKKLEINGVGYRVNLQGKKAVFSLGYSHPIEFDPPSDITISIDEEKKNILIVSGPNKQTVGEVAAKIRSYRKPEPYKGKGIKYLEEHIYRKAGKAAGKDK